jgi:hypothetical protein
VAVEERQYFRKLMRFAANTPTSFMSWRFHCGPRDYRSRHGEKEGRVRAPSWVSFARTSTAVLRRG